ncbi:MAG: DNA cytosine methyltransferase [Cellulomonas sp.]|uniref:DNA cytosine methyltransferase n=1 Tax=Cellulomonas sp. TaxID=40001 RepID=UPI0019EC5009|nr:DNA cytosine methyltransferase [Cellulomonas sp.]MBF0688433.1 DNA cytosine methyltransferase [Cellulomonas sp.]
MTSDGLPGAPFTVLDLFAGCGGLTEGFHQYRPTGATGPVFRTLGAVEWEPAAAATYAANFVDGPRRGVAAPPEIVCRDIVGWEPRWAPGEIDVVVGGPPCQGFSGLNRERVRADRNTLWQEFIRVVVAMQPKVFVIENVDRFLRSVEFQDLKERIGGADLMNYRLVDPGSKPGEDAWAQDRRYLLNAADFGAPQARRRAIVMGVRTDADLRLDLLRYPRQTHSKEMLKHKKDLEGISLPLGSEEPWATADAIFEETARRSVAAELPTLAARSVRGVGGRYPGPFRTTDLHIGRRPEQVSLARYRAIPRGGNRKDLRGRYVCRFRDGTEMITEKVGLPRGNDGELLVLGAHTVVEEGVPTSERVLVRDAVAVTEETARRRSRSQRYSAVVVAGDVERPAQLEYLSTVSWDAHDAGSGDVMGRLRRGEPSVTVRTEFFKPEKGRYLHPSEDRPITHLEAARLQGFPDDYVWFGSKIEIARQIGNAVPIPLGRRIAESIYRYLSQAQDSAG